MLGEYKTSEQIKSTDWEGRACARCLRGHWLPDPLVKRSVGTYVCLPCVYQEGDLVLHTRENALKGYVSVVTRAAAEFVDVRLLDEIDLTKYTRFRGAEALTLRPTGKRDWDLCKFGPDLCAQAIEREMSPVEFVIRKKGGGKKKVARKSKQDLLIEQLGLALIEAAKEKGVLADVLSEIESSQKGGIG